MSAASDAAGPGASPQALANATAGCSEPLLSFSVVVTKTKGASLGIDVMYSSAASWTRNGVFIARVFEGVVAEWNATSQEPHRVIPGDFIFQVNSVHGDCVSMVREIRASKTLKFHVLRRPWASRGALSAATPVADQLSGFSAPAPAAPAALEPAAAAGSAAAPALAPAGGSAPPPQRRAEEGGQPAPAAPAASPPPPSALPPGPLAAEGNAPEPPAAPAAAARAAATHLATARAESDGTAAAPAGAAVSDAPGAAPGGADRRGTAADMLLSRTLGLPDEALARLTLEAFRRRPHLADRVLAGTPARGHTLASAAAGAAAGPWARGVGGIAAWSGPASV